MIACYMPHVLVVELLLRAGASLHVKDRRGRTALDWARKRGDALVLALLNEELAARGAAALRAGNAAGWFEWLAGGAGTASCRPKRLSEAAACCIPPAAAPAPAPRPQQPALSRQSPSPQSHAQSPSLSPTPSRRSPTRQQQSSSPPRQAHAAPPKQVPAADDEEGGALVDGFVRCLLPCLPPADGPGGRWCACCAPKGAGSRRLEMS